MRSIRRQLLAWLLLGLALALAAAGNQVYRQALQGAHELSDYHLRETALSLPGGAFGPVPPARFVSEKGMSKLVIQIWSNEGVQLYLSRDGVLLPARAELGFSTVATPEGEWRVFSALEGSNIVQVAQPMSVRRELAAGVALRTIAPFLVLLPFIGALIWFTVGRGLRPLTRVAEEVEARSPSSLHALPEAGLPAEVRPLVRGLNELLARLGRALESQRAFVADAAHELRTPLTAVQLKIQLAERAKTADERRAAFAEVRQGLERASRLVAQLLTLARHELDADAPRFAAVALAEVARQAVAEHAPSAAERDIDLGIGHEAPVTVEGDFEALRIMLGNLIANAVRYTPAGGRVDVALGTAEGSAWIEVTDNGPGIPQAERGRVFDRFYRREATGTEGSGLGLAIVKQIAERHGARVALHDAQPGLRVRVTFGGEAGRPASPPVTARA